jgi:hypothetical protein
MRRREHSFSSVDACALLDSYKQEIDRIQVSFNRLKELTVTIERIVLQQATKPTSFINAQQSSKDLFSDGRREEEKHNDMLQFEEDECSTSGMTAMTTSEFSLRPCENILDEEEDDDTSKMSTPNRCNKAELFSSSLVSPQQLANASTRRNEGNRESMFSYADMYNMDSFDSFRLRLGSAENKNNASCSKTRAIVESPKVVKRRRGESTLRRKWANAKYRIGRILSKF